MTELEQPVPAGFERAAPGLGFADNLQPLYRRLDGSGVVIGMRVCESHINLIGLCHGGVFMTLADVAAAVSLHVDRGAVSPSPTVNLSFDFMASAKLGDWIEARADYVESKRRLGFCTGAIYRGDTPLVRYSGTFYYLDSPNTVSGDALTLHPMFKS